MKDETKHECLKVILIACQFTKSILMSFHSLSLWSLWTPKSCTFDQVSSRRHEFLPAEWASISTRKQLVTPRMTMKGWSSLAVQLTRATDLQNHQSPAPPYTYVYYKPFTLHHKPKLLCLFSKIVKNRTVKINFNLCMLSINLSS